MNRPILITGCQRSGTTLLSLMLDSHPMITSVDEVHFRPQHLKHYLNAPEFHPVVAFKLPGSAHEVDAFARIPGGATVWCSRGARATVASMLTAKIATGDEQPVSWARHRLGAQREINACLNALKQQGRPLHPGAVETLQELQSTGKRAAGRMLGVRAACWCWLLKMRMLRRSKKLGLAVHEVKYETLTSDPEGTMRELMVHLAVPWDPAVLQHHQSHRGQVTGGTIADRAIDQRSVERWRSVLDENELSMVHSLIGQ